ncbi:MAG TPA: alpha-amylase family glycosyl hydrolase, partial [Thermoanaerobaculia bacterium]|nr:alpha-amylase family glycosyl hydrolase [Thermoanaerobaculia bacterium]
MPTRFAHPAPDDFRGLLYRLEPDFTKPLLKVPEAIAARIRTRLAFLYGPENEEAVYREVERVIRVHDAHSTPQIREKEAAFDRRRRFSQRDAILITYGDLLVSDARAPLRALAHFTQSFFHGLVTTLHILPFFPYSSDRGFSVITYEEVDPRLGSWEEIGKISKRFKLMFDGVFNHVSARSRKFQRFLIGDPEAKDWFRVFSSRGEIDDEDRRLILRPRTTELLTEFATVNGPKYVWTTFSADQVDLNFKNPRVLVSMLEILLTYVRRGADLVRLDAITYLWYELGTRCAHLTQTHEVVKLFRDVLDVCAPHVALVTETNVPHEDNVSYFGGGTDEAQMVYNFALPPLVLHAFHRGSAETLRRWARTLEPPSDETAFFNFLDSHDGIGVMGARGILPEAEILELCRRVEAHGGFVSMKSNGDGTESPYELNTTWWSALNKEDAVEPFELMVDRFVSSRAIALALRGVPGIYLPSLFGAKNDVDAVKVEGVKRSINRTAL